MTGPTQNAAGNELVKVAYANNEAGPRDVLVAASDVPVARDVLREVDLGEREPLSRSRADRPSPVIVGLLIAVALVVLVVCVATDVIV